jgi:hypothetical protein
VLLDDEAEAKPDDGSLCAAANEGLLDSAETATDSTTLAYPFDPDVWHDIDEVLETAQRLRRSEQKPSMFDCMRLYDSSSRAPSELLHDHISAADQSTFRARSEATMAHPARSYNQPPDQLSPDQSTKDESELIRPGLNSDTFDVEERQRQEGEQEDEDCDNDDKDGRQPQQEIKEDVAAALVTGKVSDSYLYSKKGESPVLANYDSFSVGSTSYCLSQPSHTGDVGWTEDRTAELEREVELASECTGSRLEEPRDGSRHGTLAQAPEEWEPWEEELVEGTGGVEMLQQKATDDADEKEATETLPATKCRIDERSLQFRNHEHCHISPTTRSPSASGLPNPAPGGEPATGKRSEKRGHQDAHTEFSTEAQHSVNNDDTCDTDDEDPRPAKRRKLRSARAVTPPLYLRRSSPVGPPLTTRPEIDDAQSQDNHGCSPTFVDEQHCASRTSRSPSAAPVAEYQEWLFQGFLKRIRIGEEVTYNLEFKLPSISEHLHLPIDPAVLDICSSREAPAKVPTHSKIHQAPLKPKKGRAKWTKWTTEEDATLLQMKNDGCSWEVIHAALPHRSMGTIQVHYSTKLKG